MQVSRTLQDDAERCFRLARSAFSERVSAELEILGRTLLAEAAQMGRSGEADTRVAHHP